MGTLTSQPERKFNQVSISQVDGIVQTIKEMVQKHGMSTSDAIEIYKIAVQVNLNKATIEDWNIKDEQLGGFGEILSGISDTLEKNYQYPSEK